MSVPPHVLAASLAALALHDSELAVAHLVRDSTLDGPGPCATPGARSLCFENDQLTVHLDVVEDGRRRQVSLAVSPPDYGHATLLQPGNDVRADFPPPAAEAATEPGPETTVGPVTVGSGLTAVVLRRRAGESAVRTAWVVI